jgi:hypothetical protein
MNNYSEEKNRIKFPFLYNENTSVCECCSMADAAVGDPATTTPSRDFFPQQKRGKSGYIDSNRLRKPTFDHERHPLR